MYAGIQKGMFSKSNITNHTAQYLHDAIRRLIRGHLDLDCDLHRVEGVGYHSSCGGPDSCINEAPGVHIQIDVDIIYNELYIV